MTSFPAPRLTLHPLKAGLIADESTELTLLARIQPAEMPGQVGPRPSLNLALVIDRSGSMAGRPLAMARHAAQAGLRLLRPEDRVSVVTFDHEVEIVIPSQPALDPEALCRAIDRIESGGSTALHSGWLDGATEVAQHHSTDALNRVLLLSDGQANQGKRTPREIVPDVQGLTARGVSTSTIGLGLHYDEDLLSGMAIAGDGNFEHIESPTQLPAFFEAEFGGMARTSGHTVSLGIEPNPALGPVRPEVLNDLELNSLGRYQLPNLISSRPLEVVFTLPVPAQPQQGPLGITRVRLAWTGRDGIRRTQRTQLNLPVVTRDAYRALPEDKAVRLALELQRNAQAKRDAVKRLDAGDVHGARTVLDRRHRTFRDLSSHLDIPDVLLQQEVQQFSDLGDDVTMDANRARKRALSQNFDRSRSKP